MIAIQNPYFPLCPQAGDGESHGDPVIVVGVDVPSPQVSAVYDDTVIEYLIINPQCGQALSHGGNAVTLLHPQFLCSAQDRAPLGAGRGNKQCRKFIDGKGHLLPRQMPS